MRRALVATAGVATLVLAWWAAVATGLVSRVLVPAPPAVAAEAARLLAGPILPDLAASLRRVGCGLALAIAVGVPAGVAIGASRLLHLALHPPLDMIRSLPVIALVPLYIIILGVGEVSKVALVVGAVAPLLCIATAAGVRAVPEAHRLLARSLGLTRLQALRMIILPGAAPFVAAGLRLALSAALTVVVAAEMLCGAEHGLGSRIAEAQLLLRVPELYATVLVTGAVGWLANLALRLVERRRLHWIGR
jgi:ABC-type nitrate/sulfonate/bicarbonate transport system permease component